jgi:hypothetical protein
VYSNQANISGRFARFSPLFHRLLTGNLSENPSKTQLQNASNAKLKVNNLCVILLQFSSKEFASKGGEEAKKIVAKEEARRLMTRKILCLKSTLGKNFLGNFAEYSRSFHWGKKE